MEMGSIFTWKEMFVNVYVVGELPVFRPKTSILAATSSAMTTIERRMVDEAV
jgi:hypothetical protein